MKVITSSAYKVMPWRNGQGVTSEIEIYPADADVSKNNFIWRVSSARIRTASPFSLFLGFDRILAVWKGQGLRLNDELHEPMTPFSFSGNESKDCEPVGEEVTDLGIIYRREKVEASMETKNFPAHPVQKMMSLPTGIHFFICAKGSFSVNGLSVSEGDTLRTEGETSLTVETNEGARCFHIHINFFGPSKDLGK